MKHFAVIYIDQDTGNLMDAHVEHHGILSALEWAKEHIPPRADPTQPIHIVQTGFFGNHALLNWDDTMKNTHQYQPEES